MDTASIHASASNLIIEHYDYVYTSDGEPVIYITVLNTGAKALVGDLTVQLDRAYNTSQDEYGYKHVGHAIAMHDLIVEPGTEQYFEFNNVPELSKGDYRADIHFQYLTEDKEDRIDFTINQSDIVQRGTDSSSHKANLFSQFRKLKWLAIPIFIAAIAARLLIGRIQSKK
ncbi:hypothetical protein [Paenibacillus glycanilyticus]|uniref:DUF3324 domain-containing protein n=1 Tax=Paenibacillus glycanilyticus TaxID=126569 RepID=A0ABQ6GCD5_9BACL|nr:hypothetical protein [Paenibacillus glycanilyticus]GLX66918.1 hypothetical protein MU1_12620 [Paenibacillus glycanilyticus]